MFRRILNAFLPHRCLICESIVEEKGGLCSPFWSGVQFITKPYCHQCGLPLEVDLGVNALCGLCAKGEEALSCVLSLFVYNDFSKDMILKFKHGDAQHGAPVYARWMTRVGKELISSADLITSVPLH